MPPTVAVAPCRYVLFFHYDVLLSLNFQMNLMSSKTRMMGLSDREETTQS